MKLKLDIPLFGNSLFEWGYALALAFACFCVLYLISRFVSNKVAHRIPAPKALKGAIAHAFRLNLLLLLVVSLIVGLSIITLPKSADIILTRALIVALFIQGGLWLIGIVDALCTEPDPERDARRPRSPAYGLLAVMGRFVVWVLVGILVLDNLGVNVSALVAGLGIGGVAVALATQNILSDLLASLSILLDKPFEIGDFIVVGELMGTVERIGLKTTRLRSLSGEQLVLSNSSLLAGQIRNFKRMYERRILFNFGVAYHTPREALEEIPKRLKSIIENERQTRFDRAHFKKFGDSALEFEVVYFVQAPEFNLYMDIQQHINFKLMQLCEELKVEFAFPTRTVHIVK